ncbi:MAG: AAA family ATPase, partial [Tannerella sp.]|nr:AAA family ATPase [Tannerella sp.]
MMTTRRLPVGVQDFEDLRTTNCVYVDKTEYIYRLITMGKPYFLGRPRRFGKSLFLSTLKAYFLGKKELFDGLAIAELEKDWIEYPVIYIDFNVGIIIDNASLNNRL